MELSSNIIRLNLLILSFVEDFVLFVHLIYVRERFVVQSLSRVQLFVTPWTAAHQAFSSFTISWSLLRLTSTELVMLFSHLILCHPPSALVLNLTQHQGLSNELSLHLRWPRYWSFSFSISPSSEYSGLISFRIDWFDLLAVQGTLKSLL